MTQQGLVCERSLKSYIEFAMTLGRRTEYMEESRVETKMKWVAGRGFRFRTDNVGIDATGNSEISSAFLCC